MYRHTRSAERKRLQQNNCSSAKFKSTLSLSQQNWSIKDSQMVSLLEHRVVMLFCAHTTMRTEIFTCLLIFAKRSSNAFWYLPLADLCTSADICPQILPYLLIFAKDLCMSGDMGPQIFAHLLVFACRSLHVCWYLPKDLRTSAHICPQQIFAHILIFAKLLCTFADICPQQIFARILIFAKVLRMSANICPQIFTCILIFAKVFCTSADICPQIFARLLIFAKRS